MMAVLRNLVGALVMLMLTGAATAADKAIIVLDASGSMWGQIDGKPKLEIAREALRTVLQSVPADMELGLMAYGHREKGNCEDIELIVPPAAGTAEAITLAADGMQFLGKTPLTTAVRRSAEALRYTEDKATVILVTDGLETCNADPCALGNELEQSGIDFTAHVVGFGLTEEEGRQVSCLADNTGGKYIQADDSAGLQDALAETVVAEPEPQPAPAPEPEPAPEPKVEFNIIPTTALAETTPDLGEGVDIVYVVHKANADGSRGEYVSTDYNLWKGNLEPGDYLVSSKVNHAEVEQKVTIEAGKVAKPHFVLNAGTLILRPRGTEGGDIATDAAVNVRYPGDGDTTYYGAMKAVFPVGDLRVKVTIGKGELEEVIALKAGETIDRDVVVGVGRAVLNAYYAPGMKIDAGGLFAEVFKAAKKIDGSRESVAYGYGPGTEHDLPAGDYVLVATMDKASGEAPFTVKVGERVEVDAVINGGVLAISAPGATAIEVLEAKKDIQGSRKSMGVAYGETHQTTLPAGDYVVVADRGDNGGKKEASATVKAGERAEVTVP